MLEKSNIEEKPTIPRWVTLLCLATLVFGIAGHALWTADEPREAEIAREMSVVIQSRIVGTDTGIRTDWAVPYLAGKPFVEKPPLYYWLSALIMLTVGKLIGGAVAVRALSALYAALTLAVVWWTARDCLGRYRAAAAVIILATMVGFFQAAHWILIDPLLMMLITMAVLCLFNGLDRDRPLLIPAAYLSAGLALLTKGFVALGLLALPGIVLFILYRQSLRRRWIFHLAGIILLLGPGLLWASVFYSQGGPALWKEWFVNNQIGRFSGKTTHSHIHGPLYYFGVAPGLLLPWTILLLGGLFRRRERNTGEPTQRARSFLKMSFAWAIGGFVLLSLAGTKRDIYLYPLLPGFAILCVFVLSRVPRWVEITYRFLLPILVLPAAVLAFLSPVIGAGTFSIAGDFKPVVLLCALIGIFALLRLKDNLPARIAAVTGILYLTAVFAVFPVIDAEKNYEPATRRIAAAIPETQMNRVCGWNTDETTQALFSYYTGLTLTDLRDKVQPEKNLGRLAEILSGRDKQYDAVIVLLKRESEFPPEGMPPARYRMLAEARMGKHRRLLLLIGVKDADLPLRAGQFDLN